MASGDVGGAIEVDARLGLLISSISEYKNVYPVLLQAVQMLVKYFDESKINGTQRNIRGDGARAESGPRDSAFQIQSSSHVLGFVKAGALGDAVDAMHMYHDRPELIGEILSLFSVLLESNHHQFMVAAELNRSGMCTQFYHLFSIRSCVNDRCLAHTKLTYSTMMVCSGLLGALSKIARSSQYQDHAGCLHRLVALLYALARGLEQANSKQRTQAIEVVAQMMVRSVHDMDSLLLPVQC